MRVWGILAAASLALAACDETSAPPRVTVVDGDGLRYGGAALRIAGIDAPEMGQPCQRADGSIHDCGAAMRDLLVRDVALSRPVCVDAGERSHNRVVARCEIDGRDLGAALIEAGRALAHPRFATPLYVELEREAKSAGRGLWAMEMMAPWEYRRAQRAQFSPNPPPQAQADCRIKGNISRTGEMIYHAPGQRDYAKVRISPGRGERCFATETAARSAGWRRARR